MVEGREMMDYVQNEAVNAFLKLDKGTVVAHTGIGKTFIFFKALYALRDKGFPLNRILFLAEVQDREFDLKKNAEDFKRIYNKDPYTDFDIDFLCYQSAYKLSSQQYDFVCADEIHFAMSPRYSKFFHNNEIKKLLGITATLEEHVKYKGVSKGDLTAEIAPVFYEYDINTGRDNKTFRQLEVYVITHGYTENKTIKKKTKKGKVFYVSEQGEYDYWTRVYAKAFEEEDNFLREVAVRKRASIIYNSPTRKELLRKLVNKLEKHGDKTLVFGNSLDVLHEIVPTTISSRNSPEKNSKIRDLFEKNKISLIGSFKKLKQGANLPKLKNVIIHSYYSSEGDLVQRIGRARLADDAARIFIFLNPDTVELNWFTSMMNGLDIDPIYINNIDLLKL